MLVNDYLPYAIPSPTCAIPPRSCLFQRLIPCHPSRTLWRINKETERWNKTRGLPWLSSRASPSLRPASLPPPAGAAVADDPYPRTCPIDSVNSTLQRGKFSLFLWGRQREREGGRLSCIDLQVWEFLALFQQNEPQKHIRHWITSTSPFSDNKGS